jgi:hypothetical protein
VRRDMSGGVGGSLRNEGVAATAVAAVGVAAAVGVPWPSVGPEVAEPRWGPKRWKCSGAPLDPLAAWSALGRRWTRAGASAVAVEPCRGVACGCGCGCGYIDT